MDTAGKDSKKIQKYIQDQLKEDQARSRNKRNLFQFVNLLVCEVRCELSEYQLSEQLTLDLGDPFMGSK